MMIDPGAKLLAALDHAEEYRGLAIRAKDRGERNSYERIVELYVEIAEQLEALIDRWARSGDTLNSRMIGHPPAKDGARLR
jgi:hypothetical protein